MTRITIDAGSWEHQLPPPPPPVQYVVAAEGGRVHFTALHGDRFTRQQSTAHGMALTAQEAIALGRSLMLAGIEAKR